MRDECFVLQINGNLERVGNLAPELCIGIVKDISDEDPLNWAGRQGDLPMPLFAVTRRNTAQLLRIAQTKQ